MLYSVLPHIHPFAFEEEANSGDSVQLTCHASKGDLPLTIRWLHNARPIFSHLGVVTNKIGDRISLLTIPSVNDQHSGDYLCLVENKAGRVNYTARLYVNGDCVENLMNSFTYCGKCDASYIHFDLISFDLVWFIHHFLHPFGFCKSSKQIIYK